MSDSGAIDYLAQYGVEKLPMAVVCNQSDIVPTNAIDSLLANLNFVSDAQTGAPVIYITRNSSEDEVNTASVSIAEQLQEIKEKFGLNLSQLSKVLNVSRPQLYKWLEGEAVPQRNEFNQKIANVYSLTNEIPFRHSKYIGKLAKRYTPEGVTVLDAIADSELDKERLLAVYESIKSDIESIESRKADEMGKRHNYDATEIILPPNDTST